MGADAVIIQDEDCEDGFIVLVPLDGSLDSILLGSLV